MGCLQTKNETSDIHPTVFRVVNIDENGLDLCSGQLEITESDIILYREGRDSTVWPLHSLRRYGFEGEIFSFESGRRCETGEGIYAFRCRRAAQLFRSLQQHIQLRNAIHDSMPYPVSRMSPPPHSRQTLQASVIHRSSIDNGIPEIVRPIHNNNVQNNIPNAPTARAVNQAPRSPSSADILEVMPLYPRPTTNTNQVTNVYQLRAFKKEHNNNQSETGSEPPHAYSNDLSRDLAILRNTLRQEAAINTMRDIEDETRFLESRYINGSVGEHNQTLSPTLSTNSEHYAQLTIEQQKNKNEQQQQQQQFEQKQQPPVQHQEPVVSTRYYMNICTPDKHTVLADIASKHVPPTPLTPRPAEYCNFSIGAISRPEVNTYANLAIGDIPDALKNGKPLHFNATEHSQKFSESDTFTSMSPVEELEVNYAVLDIDCSSKEPTQRTTRDLMSPESQSFSSSKNESTASCSSNARARLVSQSSQEKPLTAPSSSTGPASIGYTTIDFDKTVALTSVATGEVEVEGVRKTRHNSNALCPHSPGSLDKNKEFK